MNNIQIKNEIQDRDNDTVRIVFSVTFDTGTSISDGAITITKAEWLDMTGRQKLEKVANQVSADMLSTIKTQG
ncbi:hypothetical protein [Leuconostoc citreum]|uniref:hypothetical protein n=1 Tax=Leuconostoc citreum TaxID=33964 RepID=UPI0012BA4638|nr:hypothetical protein [Leuconostoc citreum]QGN59906.1 hypothetical protein GJ636_00130 [Leuconostoc citreum]QGN59948.1 hypothetical protein GJ636_00360 [Leuconostoc citreum]